MNKIIVIGAGAAGLMAALSAKENGGQVTILERNDRIGRKLLATGNGRCNYTNINLNIENYHGRNSKFAYSALSQFDVYRTMSYFEELGITPRVEERGKVFPASLQSSSMIDIFNYEIKNRNIDLQLNSFVKNIYKEDNFKVQLEDGRVVTGDKIILATGGMSLENTGSDGNGYNLADKLGHEIIETFPGIVQLNLESDKLKEKSGVRFDGIAELHIDGEYIMEDEGDVLFTDYGISGPTILQLSRRAIDGLRNNKDVSIHVQVIKDRNMEELYEYLIMRFQNMNTKPLRESLIGLINKKLINPIIKTVRLDGKRPVAEIANKDVRRLADILTSWKFKVIGHQPWEFAQVTAGGIDTKSIDNRTMESKIVPGLYIVGEVMDIDGDCGGYNLQWAWSSGYLAGKNASEI